MSVAEEDVQQEEYGEDEEGYAEEGEGGEDEDPEILEMKKRVQGEFYIAHMNCSASQRQFTLFAISISPQRWKVNMRSLI